MKNLLYLFISLVFLCSTYAEEYQFDWDNSPKQPQAPGLIRPKNNQSVPQTPPSSTPNFPRPGGQLFPHRPNQSPFFDIQKRMEEMSKHFSSRLGDIFDDPFFKSPFGNHPFFGKQQPFPPQPKQRPNPQNPGSNFFSPFGQMMPKDDIKVINKSKFVIVEIPTKGQDVSNIKIELNGRMLSIEQNSETQEKNQSKNSFRSFQSQSSSSRSFSLPAGVSSQYSQTVVGDKLILTIPKN